ncbi:MAG: four-helix bundle copper-binding protein [Magnetococcales bacterium]|nr:four-helix bundle copper-binding protein [Magnetococcales bacterium]
MQKSSDESQTAAGNPLNRRDLLVGASTVGAGLLAATLTPGSALAEMDHAHHHGGGTANEAVIDAALDCVKTGSICLDHCITLLGSGDVAMKECMDSVSEMLPACSALARLAALDSAHLKQFAQVCITICIACEKACAQHKDKHAQCRACMESCQKCIAACKKLIG